MQEINKCAMYSYDGMLLKMKIKELQLWTTTSVNLTHITQCVRGGGGEGGKQAPNCAQHIPVFHLFKIQKWAELLCGVNGQESKDWRRERGMSGKGVGRTLCCVICVVGTPQCSLCDSCVSYTCALYMSLHN